MSSRKKIALGTLVIVALALISYRPILPGSFVWDDRRLIEADNPLVNGTLSPFSIWFQTDFSLTTFFSWLEWRAWGGNAGFYHLVNILLQAASGLLIWRLLARLKIPGAWLAAAIFTVHPVGVGSVARIAELKNLLSLPFFLLSLLIYLHHEAVSLDRDIVRDGPSPPLASRELMGAFWYGVSLIAFVLALLSKTSTVMLPVVLLACAAWQRGKITKPDLLYTSPFFALALAFGAMSAWFQKYLAMAGQTLPHQSFWERLAIAGRVFWFYLGKALFPLNLCAVYPRWKIDAAALTAYLPGLFLCAVIALCWKFRRAWGRHVLFGLASFAITLFPALGFFDAQYMTWFQVSDHLEYLPLIAPVALVAAGVASLPRPAVSRCIGAALVLALAVLTFNHAQVFATEECLWRDTLARNPKAGAVHGCLGVILAKKENYPEALEHFKASLQFGPDTVDTRLNLGRALVQARDAPGAGKQFRAALKLAPDSAVAHQGLAWVLRQSGKDREAVRHLEAAVRLKPDIETRVELASLLYKTGNFRRAAIQFRKVVSLAPDSPESLNNLAWLLATCSDEAVRDGREAVRHAERACRHTRFKQTAMVGTLAAAYAEAGRFPEAVSTGELALNLATASGETRFAAISQQLLRLYVTGKPWHEMVARNETNPLDDAESKEHTQTTFPKG